MANSETKINQHSSAAGEQLSVLSILSRLTQLNMKGCYRVADQGLCQLAALPCLHRLNLHGCWQITAAGLANLSGHLTLASKFAVWAGFAFWMQRFRPCCCSFALCLCFIDVWSLYLPSCAVLGMNGLLERL